ncbi:proline/betaine transporter [Holospora elegans E1]|uniref:Proline/betaine transporter n=1 Tax=Holospora elegans E1 TaxID=1427503 RepID=A0A023DYU5_9PROT|nr:MFS transporter [Holospora elegans]GAJ46175.1 proline/betaine transporter [Holospora elegans E1]
MLTFFFPKVRNTDKHFRKVLISSMIGNTLEWYDFMLYGYCAAIIGALFFPANDAFSSMLATYGVFFVGFVMRPLGGILFGYLGDRIGRKGALVWSIYCMAIPTALIGMLPTYEQIGWFAPLFLTCLRLFQGLSMGGEFTGSIVFVVEHADPQHRGFWGSWTTFSAAIGVLIGSCMCVAVGTLLSESEFLRWGWRVPFILSITGSIVGAFVRNRLQETEAFSRNSSDNFSWKKFFARHGKSLLQLVCLDVVVAIGFFTICLFIVNYLQNFVGVGHYQATCISTIATLGFALSIPIGGYCSDRVGRKPVLRFASLLLLCAAIPAFIAFSTGNIYQIFFAQLALNVAFGVYYGVIPAAIVELFPPSIRCLGVSLAHNVTMMVFGGTAPTLAVFFIKEAGEKSFALVTPGIYLAFGALVSFFATFWIKESYQKSIS